MPNCPHCLEEIKAGARKCPHCQTSLEPPSEAKDSTVYILDKGLIRFAKFAVGVLAIFVLVGVYAVGYDIKEASKRTSDADIQVQKALLEIERQRAALTVKIGESEQKIARIEALEREMAAHRNATQKSVAEASRLVLEIRGKSEEASKYVIELRTLGATETRVAEVKREEKGIDASRGKLWKIGSKLRFRFLDGENSEKNTVRLAINQWAEYVNLTFEEIPTGDAEIRISFKERGSWSFTGTDALGIPASHPTLNYEKLGQVIDRKDAIYSAVHEFGHALGLAHEHQNPQAGDVFDRVAVLAFYSGPPNWWDNATIEKNMFAKVEYPGARPYDPESVMTYSFPRHLFLPGKETRPGTGLSESDKRYVASLYPRG
jgi:hypothetical protein